MLCAAGLLNIILSGPLGTLHPKQGGSDGKYSYRKMGAGLETLNPKTLGGCRDDFEAIPVSGMYA